jgi:O-methyltransferase
MNAPASLVHPAAIDSLMYYASRAPYGAIVEIGVYKGGTAWHLDKLHRPLYLYDSFEGMPTSTENDVHQIGVFADCSAEAVQAAIPSAHVIKGMFPDSLVPMPPVGFVHADADQYESTKAILEVMPPLMVRGGFILFDDYMVDDCPGCTRALLESPYRILVIAETGKALVIV